VNRTETVLLCRYVKAMCPAQAIDEYTPDAWADVLDDIELEDAKDAIRDGVRDRGWRFIDVTDVVAAVRAERVSRWDAYYVKHGFPVPPARFADDPAAGNRWLAEARRRIVNGEATEPEELDEDPAPIAAPRRDVIAELGQVGREVPRA